MADTTQAAAPPPEDPSKYIRTYAKDMAALSGQPAPVSVPAPSTHTAPEAGIQLPEVDESPVQRAGDAPKEFEPEVLETSKEDEQAVFASKAPQPKEPALFASIPHAPISVTPIVAAPTETTAPTETRESLLARLRARAGQTPAPTMAVPAPAPESVSPPAPEPIPAPPTEALHAPVAPSTQEAPAFASETTLQSIMGEATGSGPIPSMPIVSKDLPPAPPAFTPSPIPVPQPPRPVYTPPPFTARPAAPAPVQSSLHTFKTDFADRIDQQQASTFSVLAAASDAGQATSRPAPAKRSIAPIIIGVVLFVAGIGAVGGAGYYYLHLPRTARLAQVPSLVVPDETVEVHGQGAMLMQAIADLANQPAVSGNVVVTYLASTTAASRGLMQTPEQGGALIDAMNLPAPSILLRNLDPLSTVGIITAGGQSKPFFILRVTSYERTFAGMLGWEPTIGDDLKILFPAYTAPQAAPAPVATTTAATTTPAKKGTKPAPAPVVVVPPAPQPPHFVDETVVSHDVRALKDSTGRTILLYGYHDKSTLLIVRNEDAFTELVNRLNAAAGQ